MKLTDYLNPEQILLDFDGPSKEEGLKAVAQVLASHPTSASVGQQLIYEALNARENLGSTGIGDGIAILIQWGAACWSPSNHRGHKVRFANFERVLGELPTDRKMTANDRSGKCDMSS